MSKGFGYAYTGTKGHLMGVIGSLLEDPDILLRNGWKELSRPEAKAHGHRKFEEEATGLLIEFDEKTPGAPGFRGANHYHILNPDATDYDTWNLDKDGNPVPRHSTPSHILPEGATK